MDSYKWDLSIRDCLSLFSGIPLTVSKPIRIYNKTYNFAYFFLFTYLGHLPICTHMITTNQEGFSNFCIRHIISHCNTLRGKCIHELTDVYSCLMSLWSTEDKVTPPLSPRPDHGQFCSPGLPDTDGCIFGIQTHNLPEVAHPESQRILF